MAPLVAVTYRLYTRVVATAPTFCEKTVSTKALKIPPRTPDIPSATSPRARSAFFKGFPVISLTASMLAVDSAKTTAMTILIATTAVTGNSGAPKWNGIGKPTQASRRTPLRSIRPIGMAITVPITSAISTPSCVHIPRPRQMKATATTTTAAASARFFGSANDGEVGSFPTISPPATPINEMPMTVRTTPVTRGGK